jgi:hypothetical protein
MNKKATTNQSQNEFNPTSLNLGNHQITHALWQIVIPETGKLLSKGQRT